MGFLAVAAIELHTKCCQGLCQCIAGRTTEGVTSLSQQVSKPPYRLQVVAWIPLVSMRERLLALFHQQRLPSDSLKKIPGAGNAQLWPFKKHQCSGFGTVCNAASLWEICCLLLSGSSSSSDQRFYAALLPFRFYSSDALRQFALEISVTLRVRSMYAI